MNRFLVRLPGPRARAVAWESVRSGFSEIRAHKLRSGLTLTGITMGVFSLILIFSLFRGLRVTLGQALSEGGWSRILYLYTAAPENPKARAWLSAGKGLSYEDAEALRLLPDVAAATAGITTRASVRRGTREYVTDVVGVDPQYLQVQSNRKLAEGRWIADTDVEAMRRVCVVGRLLQRELYPAGAVGEEIVLAGVRLPIVGVLERPKGIIDDGMDYDDERAVYVPVTTVAKYLAGSPRPQSIQVRIHDGVSPGAALAEVRDALLRRHAGVPDFGEFNVAEMLLRFSLVLDEILGNLDIVFGTIAGTSLLVGGLGIVSVLLIAIRERVFEIGVRKAVGADDSDLLLQLLVESLVLTAIGSALGVVLAFALTAVLTAVLATMLPTGLPFSLAGTALACAFAGVVGLFSGLYPALLAARMRPVEALAGNT